MQCGTLRPSAGSSAQNRDADNRTRRLRPEEAHMGLSGVFDDRSLRTKIGTAVLTAAVSGLAVGGLALTTVRHQSTDSATAQRRTIAVEEASGAFAKNIEAYGGSVSALKLYPSIKDLLLQGMKAEEAEVTGALARLQTN